MLLWASQFSIFLFLDSNGYQSGYDGYECLLAAGIVSCDDDIFTLSDLQRTHDEIQDWLFGHICYDHKNVLEPKLKSIHSVKSGFADIAFFRPATVIHINRAQTVLSIESFGRPDDIFCQVTETKTLPTRNPIPKLRFRSVVDRGAYLKTIAQLRKHISDGDCYEINFCCEGFCNDADISPLDVFNELNTLSPAPFAAFYKAKDDYLMCASPERYLRRSGTTIMTQPIKGTAARGASAELDELYRTQLQNSIKERAENVMIVDLVRNDLSRCCETGSIKVDDLFGIHTFPQVHQMISTVSGKLAEGAMFTDAIRYSFPMGSMTGAPKFKVMQLIDEYERSRRTLFSGSVGYITPEGNFDLNVVIRSLFYNSSSRYLSYQTGGAITYDSDAEQEWEEMRLKAWAMERIFV